MPPTAPPPPQAVARNYRKPHVHLLNKPSMWPPLLLTLTSHVDSVEDVCFSPNGGVGGGEGGGVVLLTQWWGKGEEGMCGGGRGGRAAQPNHEVHACIPPPPSYPYTLALSPLSFPVPSGPL